MPLEEVTADSGFDIGSAMDSVATSLTEKEHPNTEVDDAPAEQQEVAATAPVVAASDTPVTVREAPKSWSKDKHELWSKLPPEAQDYYSHREKQMLDGLEQYKGDAAYAKQLKDALTPYRAMLQSQGVDDVSAVNYLMNAHYRLTNGTESSRRAAFDQLSRELGFSTAQVAGETSQTTPIDPVVKGLQEKLERIESGLSARQQAERNEAYAKHMTETESFANDPANAYFGEVANDMVGFIKQGMPLKEAYDRAVWANPVTRTKEQARLQTEAAAKLVEKSKPEVEAARKATAINVRGAESRREPTEPKGSMEDTMREQLATIKRRVN